jgi:glucosyl-3-phosphoglycerate synthase
MRTFHHTEFPAARLRAVREDTISVCVPAREEAKTIAAIVEPLVALREQNVLDQVLVIDSASRDGTGAIAAAIGADVVDASSILPEFGPINGKGDAMWRALSVASGELVCFVDADSEDFGAHFALGLLGPLVCEPHVQFVKGFYRRPFKANGGPPEPTGGGRVTELTARPLLQAFYPELAGVRQPLAGEFAARRALLERVPFCTGYAVEMGLLLDVHADVGIDALAQVDLDVRQNRHQPLENLRPMADAVLGAVTSRMRREGRLHDETAAAGSGLPERPPLVSLRAPVSRPE